eukprot:g6970.t1
MRQKLKKASQLSRYSKIAEEKKFLEQLQRERYQGMLIARANESQQATPSSPESSRPQSGEAVKVTRHLRSPKAFSPAQTPGGHSPSATPGKARQHWMVRDGLAAEATPPVATSREATPPVATSREVDAAVSRLFRQSNSHGVTSPSGLIETWNPWMGQPTAIKQSSDKKHLPGAQGPQRATNPNLPDAMSFVLVASRPPQEAVPWQASAKAPKGHSLFIAKNREYAGRSQYKP